MTSIIKYKEHKEKISHFKELAIIANKSGNYSGMSQETLLNLMLSAEDLGVSPMKAINGSFHIIKGKIVMAGHLISDRIRSSGHSIKVTEHTREKCVIIGLRKDNGDSYKSEFDIEDAKLAGLINSDNWKKYPKDMLYNRAIARLGRVLFSDVVGACYSEDERFDIENISYEKRNIEDPDLSQDWDKSLNHPKTQQVEEMIPETSSSFDDLKNYLESNGIPTEQLSEYLDALSKKNGQGLDVIIECALNPDLKEKFKASYVKNISKIQGVAV